MRNIVTCIASAALMAGCNVLETTVNNDRTAPLAELAVRRTAWDDANISNYDFDYVHDCECPDAAQQPVTIEVRGDLVSRVLDADGNEVASVTGISWPTMDSLFIGAKAELENEERGVQVLFADEQDHITRLRSFHIQTQQGLDDHVVTNFAVVAP